MDRGFSHKDAAVCMYVQESLSVFLCATDVSPPSRCHVTISNSNSIFPGVRPARGICLPCI